jgi:hypothetical protein
LVVIGLKIWLERLCGMTGAARWSSVAEHVIPRAAAIASLCGGCNPPQRVCGQRVAPTIRMAHRGRAQYSELSRLSSVPSVPSVMAPFKLKCRLDLRSASGVRPARIIRPIRPIRHGGSPIGLIPRSAAGQRGSEASDPITFADPLGLRSDGLEFAPDAAAARQHRGSSAPFSKSCYIHCAQLRAEPTPFFGPKSADRSGILRIADYKNYKK